MPTHSRTSELELTHVAKLAFLLAPGRLCALRAWLEEFVPEAITADVAYEIILQSYLFFGYAQAIEAVKLFAELNLNKYRTRTTELEVPNREELVERGEALCTRIYAPNFERLVENMRAVSPELADWMVVEGYGRVLSRPGPSEIAREVASIVFLVCSGHPVQLYSHVRGARNLGLSRDQLERVLSGLGFETEQRLLMRETIEKVYVE